MADQRMNEGRQPQQQQAGGRQMEQKDKTRETGRSDSKQSAQKQQRRDKH